VNEGDGQVSRTGMLVDTMFRRLWKRMFSMSLGQTCDKPLCHKHVSLFGYGQCENLLVFLLDGNPQPDAFRTSLDCRLVNYEFGNSLFLWGYPFGATLLNPLPDCNVASLYNVQKDNALAAFLVDKPGKYKYRP
jgi:hypothetical protein